MSLSTNTSSGTPTRHFWYNQGRRCCWSTSKTRRRNFFTFVFSTYYDVRVRFISLSTLFLQKYTTT